MLKHKLLRACVLLCLALNIQQGKAQETNGLEYGAAIRGMNQDPKQKSIGSKPYEMEGRTEAREPLFTFDDCTQWQVRANQSEVTLYRTKEQRVIGDYSGKVVYKTKQAKAGFRVELASTFGIMETIGYGRTAEKP